MYSLTDEEKKRLVEAIRATYTIPFIDDIENYIWERLIDKYLGVSMAERSWLH